MRFACRSIQFPFWRHTIHDYFRIGNWYIHKGMRERMNKYSGQVSLKQTKVLSLSEKRIIVPRIPQNVIEREEPYELSEAISRTP